MTKIKICGITNLADALHSAECGVDALGFNFYAKSSRYVEPTVVRNIVEKLSGDVFNVGVFVNEDSERIVEVVNEIKLDAVQLHGDESPELVNRLMNELPDGVEVIKAFRVRLDFHPGEVLKYGCETVLLDAFSNDEFGGSGKTFNWEMARSLTSDKKVFLAGGLSGENVGDAIRTVRPYAVDACSRLELSPGKKDREKVKLFIDAVKQKL